MRSIKTVALACVLAAAVSACSSSSGGGSTAIRSAAASAVPHAATSPAPSVAAPTGTAPSSSAGTSGCDTDSLTPLCDHVAFTGAIPVRGNTVQSALGPAGLARSCADVAAGSKNGSFEVPQGSIAPVGGHVVTVDALVKAGHYHGAGTYSAIDLDASGGIAVDQTQFQAGPASTASVTVNADGSGKLTFASLVSTDGRSESGELSWICSF